jgi:osmotically-inducible protein OsmY
VGFASGVLTGMIAGSMVVRAHGPKVKRAIGRLRRDTDDAPVDPKQVRDAVEGALHEHEVTAELQITVHSPGAGLVELTGLVPDAVARQVAGDVARSIPGAEVVVNRILVNGRDVSKDIPAS